MKTNKNEASSANLTYLQSQFQVLSKQFAGSGYDLFGYPFSEYQFEFSWRSREEYLRFRDGWQVEYAELSELIRTGRGAFRRRHREASGGMEAWRGCWPGIRAFCEARDLAEPGIEDEGLNWSLKSHARFLLQMREAARRHAGACRERSMVNGAAV